MSATFPRGPQGPGFTKIEALVVLLIVAILTYILAPVFIAAREKARAVTCQPSVIYAPESR